MFLRAHTTPLTSPDFNSCQTAYLCFNKPLKMALQTHTLWRTFKYCSACYFPKPQFSCFHCLRLPLNASIFLLFQEEFFPSLDCRTSPVCMFISMCNQSELILCKIVFFLKTQSHSVHFFFQSSEF